MDIDKYYEGLLFKQDGKIVEALEALEEAAGEDAASAPAWNEIGLIYDDDGRVASVSLAPEPLPRARRPLLALFLERGQGASTQLHHGSLRARRGRCLTAGVLPGAGRGWS